MKMPHELDRELCRNALSYLMFLKRKRTGKVKARGCADGRPQRDYISKEESSSPTVSLYSLMLSCCIDAIEDRKVVTVDVPAAFLQSSWPKDKPTYLKFEGVMVEILLELDPSLTKNVITTKKGKKVMYGDL